MVIRLQSGTVQAFWIHSMDQQAFFLIKTKMMVVRVSSSSVPKATIELQWTIISIIYPIAELGLDLLGQICPEK